LCSKNCTVALLETLDALVPQAVDEVVHERLARHVPDGQAAPVVADEVRDSVEKVGLAEPGVSVDEERVVRLCRRLCDGEGCGVGEAVRRSDDERVERVLRVDADRLGTRDREQRYGQRLRERPSGARRSRRGRSRLVAPVDTQPHPELLPPCDAGGRAEEVEEVPLDPFAGEIVRNSDHERVAVELGAGHAAEPGLKRRVVESLAQAVRHIAPERFRRQPELPLHLPRSTFRP
jgi:hypothetical protein